MHSSSFFAKLAISTLLFSAEAAFCADSPSSGEMLQTMEDRLPLTVSVRRRVLFSSLDDMGGFPGAFVCETDRGASGGEFFFFSTNGTPHILRNEDDDLASVYYCLPEEWYRLADTAGNTIPVVVAMRRWHDGTDEAGLLKEAFLSVFRFENGHVTESRIRPSFADLIASPSFFFLERLPWHFARKSEEGVWSVNVVSNTPCLFGPQITPQDRVAALASFLHDRTNAPPVVASNVVFEADSGRTPFFALVSDGTNATEDGWLWIPFLWNGTEWTDAPTNGFDCASGRCPAAFRARPDEFYLLAVSDDAPRLVVLKNREGDVHELFWEEALGPNVALLDFKKGMPCDGYMSSFGLPDAPLSVFQSLPLGRKISFFRLERLVPEPLLP